MKKIVLKILIGSLCLSALIGIGIILFGELGEIEGKLLATSLLIFAYSILGLCSSAIFEKPELKTFSLVGMTFTAISCVYMIMTLWEFFEINLDNYMFAYTLSILSFSFAHISLMLLVNNKNNIVSLIKTLTIITIIIICFMILIPLWEIYTPQSFYYRILGAVGILSTLGTIVTPLLNKFYKSIDKNNNTSTNLISQSNISINNEQISQNIITNNGSNPQNINGNKKNHTLLIIIFVVVAIIITILIFYNVFNSNDNLEEPEKAINIKEILDDSPSYDFYEESNYYFIYNDKIYYYSLDLAGIDYTDKLFSMDLDGSNNTLIAETDELRYAMFDFVYNDEAYYYTMYDNDNKKINLKTGKITSLKNSDIYLPKTLNNGVVNTLINSIYAEDNYSIFKKVDLNNNKTIYETRVNQSMSGEEYFFDYDGGNIYYLENYYSYYPTIYKNNEVMYEFLDYTKYNLAEIEFIACNDIYLYFEQNNTIYKLNTETKIIEKEIIPEVGGFNRISSGNNTDNYYYANKKIYSFDFESDTFILVIEDDLANQPEEVYKINNKLYFTENTNNLKYGVANEILGSVIIYDLTSGEMNNYKGVRKASFDNNYMYLVINGVQNYTIEKVDLYD